MRDFERQMTVANLAFIATGLIIVVLAAWYLTANLDWIRVVRERDPTLVVDPVAQPVQWATSAPSRLRRLLATLRSPSEDARLEAARVRTVHRAIAACVLGALAVLGLPPAAAVVATFLSVEIERGGVTGGAIFVILLGILAYWLWRLVRAMYRYGNGLPVSPTEVAFSIFGLISAVVVAAVVSATPVGAG